MCKQKIKENKNNEKKNSLKPGTDDILPLFLSYTYCSGEHVFMLCQYVLFKSIFKSFLPCNELKFDKKKADMKRHKQKT